MIRSIRMQKKRRIVRAVISSGLVTFGVWMSSQQDGKAFVTRKEREKTEKFIWKKIGVKYIKFDVQKYQLIYFQCF